MNASRKIVVFTFLISMPALAATVSIEKIVKSGDAVPGRPFATVVFRGRSAQLPGTINESGVVAFQAHSENPANSFTLNDPIVGTRQGIYVRVPGFPLKVVADTTITSAGGPGTFAVPGRPNAKFDQIAAAPLLNNAGDVIFAARYSDPIVGTRFGLFATTINGTTTSIVKIVDTTDLVPGFGITPFTSFTTGNVGFVGLMLAVLNDSGQVAFHDVITVSGSSTSRGIFAGSVGGGPIIRLLDRSGTFIPSGQSLGINSIDFRIAMNNVGNVVFGGRVGGSSLGVFSVPVVGGSIATVAFQFQTAPGTALKFGATFTGPDVTELGDVAFNNQLDTSGVGFDQGDYVGDVSGGPRTVAMDTLGGFVVPGRPPSAAFDRLSHAAINESGRLAPFARVVNSGVPNDQGIYLAEATGTPIVRIIDAGAVPPGLVTPAKLQSFDPSIGATKEPSSGGSAAINDQSNLVLTGTGVTAANVGMLGIYFYDQCASELVRISDSTISPSAPPVGLGGTFSTSAQALFGFQNSESRSGHYRTINEDNDVTFLGRFNGLEFGIYVAHITTSGGGQLAITCPPDVSLACPANTDPSATGLATATGCGTVTITHSDVTTAGCGGTASVSRTWTASNGSTTASCVQSITEIDTVGPVLSGVPSNASVQCDALPPAASVTALDGCEGSIPVTLTETQVAGLCPGTYVLTRTWTATDGCGNSTSASQDVALMDTLDPILVGVPTDVSVECDAVPAVPVVTSSDTCDTSVPVTFVETQADGTCPDEHVLTRTWTAVDDCGNDVTASQFITVDDTTAPTITCPAHASLECPADTGILANGTATGSDNCGVTSIGSTDSTVTGCGTSVTVTRTWTATDECSNAASCNQFVSVLDTTAPTLTVDTTPITVTDVDCDGSAAATLPTGSASDACDGAVAVSNNAPAFFPAGVTTPVTYTATDACGNGANQQVDVTVLNGANIHVEAASHQVGSGSYPGSTKTPLVGLNLCAYDKAEGSCPRVVCGGISHQHYQCILDNCSPVNCCISDGNGECTINLPPGDYIVVTGDATKTVLPDPLGVSASDLACGQTMQKHLQQIVKANGQTVPAKTTRLTGSELLIIEPEYVVWDETVQLYPFVFETIGDWTVTATVAPPDGFVADYPALSTEVDNTLRSVQFTITEVGSDLVPTQTEFRVMHNGRQRTVRSKVDILLTADYARSRGFDPEQLSRSGLIVEPARQQRAPRGTPRPGTR